MLNVLPALILLLMQGPTVSNSQAQSLRMALILASHRESMVRTIEPLEGLAEEVDSPEDLLDLLNRPSLTPSQSSLKAQLLSLAWLIQSEPVLPAAVEAIDPAEDEASPPTPMVLGQLPEGFQTGGRSRDGPTFLF